MAEAVQINGTGTAKIRHPVAVAIFALITFGIYGLYWWYQVNREMVDLGKARNVDGLGDNPAMSLLAMFPGVLIIVPPFVSLFNGTQRMRRAQEITTGATPSLNGWIIVILLIVSFFTGFTLTPIVAGYMQAELNKAWKTRPVLTPGVARPAAGATEAPPPERQPPPPERQPPPPQS